MLFCHEFFLSFKLWVPNLLKSTALSLLISKSILSRILSCFQVDYRDSATFWKTSSMEMSIRRKCSATELLAAEASRLLRAEPKTLFSILQLPNELILMISEACSFNTAISLRQSCRTTNTLFNAYCKLCAPRPRNYDLSVYLERLCMDDE